MGWRRICATVISAVLFSSCAAVAYFAVAGWRLVPVLSGSMRPLLEPGDLVAARPEKAGLLLVGQTIVYTAPVDDHPVILHRVIEVRRNGNDVLFRTKGDANNTPDAWTASMAAADDVLVFRGNLPRIGRAGHDIAARGSLLPVALVGVLTVLLLAIIWRPRRVEPAERAPTTVRTGEPDREPVDVG